MGSTAGENICALPLVDRHRRLFFVDLWPCRHDGRVTKPVPFPGEPGPFGVARPPGETDWSPSWAGRRSVARPNTSTRHGRCEDSDRFPSPALLFPWNRVLRCLLCSLSTLVVPLCRLFALLLDAGVPLPTNHRSLGTAHDPSIMRGDPSGDSDDTFPRAGDPPELRLLGGTPHAALPGTGEGRGLAVPRAFVSNLSLTRRGGGAECLRCAPRGTG